MRPILTRFKSLCARSQWLSPISLSVIAVVMGGCAPDLGRACQKLTDQGVVRACAKVDVSAIRKEHHVVEEWDFREPGTGVGHGSLVRYDNSTYFGKESSDTATIAKELSGFHYENAAKLIQLETRYATDSATQSRVVIVLDDM